jgi:hypothetical protein
MALRTRAFDNRLDVPREADGGRAGSHGRGGRIRFRQSRRWSLEKLRDQVLRRRQPCRIGLRFEGEQHRDRGPRGAGGGNPLVFTMRKLAVEVRLKWPRTAPHEPRTVIELRAQEKVQPTLIRGVARGDAGFVQRDQR